MRSINSVSLSSSIIFIILLPFCEQTLNKSSENDSFCLRTKKGDFEYCDKLLTDNFCKNIQCEPVLDCEGDNKEIVENIVGRNCCPACVQYLDENENCEVGSKLKMCQNGLFCNPSTKQCNLPGVKENCQVNYHNRRLLRENRMVFYLEAPVESKHPTYFEIKYATDMELPNCNRENGKYELKQCRKSKCFCVNPENGKYTFGLTEDFRAENVTCKCADYFHKKLVRGDGKIDPARINDQIMVHYSQIHSKCDASGNFEPLQCINSTCFCVDPKTGKPTDEKAAIYGALSTLSCFDEEKSKKLKTKEADPNYLSSCEKQLLRTQSISLNFKNKGIKLVGLGSIACQFNGEFSSKQCSPGVCNCVDPKGLQMKSYAADTSGGKDVAMECRCAREEYHAEYEKQAYNQLQCDGSGNYKAFQCYDNGRACYCVDEDGSRISESEPSTCLDSFIKEKDQALIKEEICRNMRKTLVEKPMKLGKFYKFDRPHNTYVEFSTKPTNMYCGNSQCKC